MRIKALGAAILAFGLVGVVAWGQRAELPLPGAQREETPSPPEPVQLEPVGPSLPLPGPGLPPGPAASESAQEDPMQVVEAFVERNRKEAEGAIDKLSKEAEALRARLQKVEAALERWRAVEGALKQGPVRPGAAAKPGIQGSQWRLKSFNGPPAASGEPPATSSGDPPKGG